MSFLDPGAVHLERRDDQPPTLSIAGDLFFSVKIRQAFPLSRESRYITFFDQDDEYLGILADPSSCDEETGRIIRDEIEWRYFRPRITRIVEMEGRGGTSLFSVETDRGDVKIPMRDLREGMVELAPSRILITDENGNRYEISDLDRLDRRSRRLIRRLI
ncbi:MAG: DUF1854 domain-containing protein [Gemmatimonadetes bacterium]|nr:DUF1854 domain-containing protein [Gemmatimonadota bacterium]